MSVRRLTSSIHQILSFHFMLQLSLVEDAEEQLTSRGMGRIHHRILYVANRSPGITVGDLLSVLNVRHQNIQNILRELVRKDFVLVRQSPSDARVRRLYTSRKGNKLLRSVSASQYARIESACGQVTARDLDGCFKLMAAMLGPERREWADRLARGSTTRAKAA